MACVLHSRLISRIGIPTAIFVGCALFAMLAASPTVAQTYRITDLGTFSGGTVSQGNAVNIVGQVAGYARFANYNAHGVLWNAGRLEDLGALPPESNFSVAQAVNTIGDIVGYSVSYAHNNASTAVLWSKGAIHDLGTLAGGDLSQANGINDLGLITGFSNSSSTEPHAVIWTKGAPAQDLGTLPGGYYSQGLGVNIGGAVACYSNAADGAWHAALWTKSNGMQPLPFLSDQYASASANAINDLGDVAGGSGNTAVLWQKSNGYQAESLGTLAGQGWSSAFAMNNYDQVVGWSGFIAFVWTRSGGMQNLNELIPQNSGWQLEAGYGINDRGQIVGQGNINGQSHGFLLTPVSDRSN